jgi:LysM repeat protein
MDQEWLFFIAVSVSAVLLILGLLAGEALFSISAPFSASRLAVIVSTACAAALFCFVTGEVAAQDPCGDTVVVRRGDTLSSIAERCGVPERRLLSANRTVKGSEDLRVGMSLSLRSPEERAGERLESFARRAGEELSGLAQEFGSSGRRPPEQEPGFETAPAQPVRSPQYSRRRKREGEGLAFGRERADRLARDAFGCRPAGECFGRYRSRAAPRGVRSSR